MYRLKSIKPIILISLFIVSSLTYDIYGQCESECFGDNTSFGNSAGENITSRFSDNSFFGFSSGRNTTGQNNSFFGSPSGSNNMTGFNNSFFGASSGRDNTTGSSNSFFGEFSGLQNTTGSSNSFFGASSAFDNTTGRSNSFFGVFSGFRNTTGSQNSFFGQNSGGANTTGINNSFFGRDSGRNNTTGSRNSFFGEEAGVQITSGSLNVIIGSGAGPTSANDTISNRLYIDVNDAFNPGNDDPLIYGEFDNDFVRINGTFEVTAGLTNPSSIKLKDRFAAVAPMLVLDKINELDISEWSYKSDPEVRHIGPTAESFYEAFGLGTGGNNISTIDADGVSLIAIQALTQELKKKDQEIDELKERLNRIEQLLLAEKK